MVRSAGVMIVIGLTGGIGCGKSTVAELLVARGAVLVDADQVVREVQAPGGQAYGAILERFGGEVVGPDGQIDRPALASVVFGDDEARADLNRIVWPAVGTVMAERVAAHAGTDAVVVLDIPLLAEGGRDRYGLAGVVVVDCPEEEQVRRLVELRGMAEADVRARIAAQASRAERLAIADVVIDNSGPPEALPAQVDRTWSWIQSLHHPLL